jgi:hypothetical protein
VHLQVGPTALPHSLSTAGRARAVVRRRDWVVAVSLRLGDRGNVLVGIGSLVKLGNRQAGCTDRGTKGCVWGGTVGV